MTDSKTVFITFMAGGNLNQSLSNITKNIALTETALISLKRTTQTTMLAMKRALTSVLIATGLVTAGFGALYSKIYDIGTDTERSIALITNALNINGNGTKISFEKVSDNIKEISKELPNTTKEVASLQYKLSKLGVSDAISLDTLTKNALILGNIYNEDAEMYGTIIKNASTWQADSSDITKGVIDDVSSKIGRAIQISSLNLQKVRYSLQNATGSYRALGFTFDDLLASATLISKHVEMTPTRLGNGLNIFARNLASLPEKFAKFNLKDAKNNIEKDLSNIENEILKYRKLKLEAKKYGDTDSVKSYGDVISDLNIQKKTIQQTIPLYTELKKSYNSLIYNKDGSMKSYQEIINNLDKTISKYAGNDEAVKLNLIKNLFGQDGASAILTLLKFNGQLDGIYNNLNNSKGSMEELKNMYNSLIKSKVELSTSKMEVIQLDIFEKTKGELGNTLDIFNKYLDKLIGNGEDGGKKLSDVLVGAFNIIFKDLGGLISGIGDSLLNFLDELNANGDTPAKNLISAFNNLYKASKYFVGSLIKSFKIITGGKSTIDGFSIVINAVSTSIIKLSNWIVKASIKIKPIFTKIFNFINNNMDNLIKTFTAVVGLVTSSQLLGFLGYITGFRFTGFQMLLGYATSLVTIFGILGSKLDDVSKKISDINKSISNKLSGVLGNNVDNSNDVGNNNNSINNSNNELLPNVAIISATTLASYFALKDVILSIGKAYYGVDNKSIQKTINSLDTYAVKIENLKIQINGLKRDKSSLTNKLSDIKDIDKLLKDVSKTDLKNMSIDDLNKLIIRLTENMDKFKRVGLSSEVSKLEQLRNKYIAVLKAKQKLTSAKGDLSAFTKITDKRGKIFDVNINNIRKKIAIIDRLSSGIRFDMYIDKDKLSEIKKSVDRLTNDKINIKIDIDYISELKKLLIKFKNLNVKIDNLNDSIDKFKEKHKNTINSIINDIKNLNNERNKLQKLYVEQYSILERIKTIEKEIGDLRSKKSTIVSSDDIKMLELLIEKQKELIKLGKDSKYKPTTINKLSINKLLGDKKPTYSIYNKLFNKEELTKAKEFYKKYSSEIDDIFKGGDGDINTKKYNKLKNIIVDIENSNIDKKITKLNDEISKLKITDNLNSISNRIKKIDRELAKLNDKKINIEIKYKTNLSNKVGKIEELQIIKTELNNKILDLNKSLNMGINFDNLDVSINKIEKFKSNVTNELSNIDKELTKYVNKFKKIEFKLGTGKKSSIRTYKNTLLSNLKKVTETGKLEIIKLNKDIYRIGNKNKHNKLLFDIEVNDIELNKINSDIDVLINKIINSGIENKINDMENTINKIDDKLKMSSNTLDDLTNKYERLNNIIKKQLQHRTKINRLLKYGNDLISSKIYKIDKISNLLYNNIYAKLKNILKELEKLRNPIKVKYTNDFVSELKQVPKYIFVEIKTIGIDALKNTINKLNGNKININGMPKNDNSVGRLSQPINDFRKSVTIFSKSVSKFVNGKIPTGVKSTIGKTMPVSTTAIGKAVSSIKPTLNSVFNGIKGAFKGAFSGIVELIKMAIPFEHIIPLAARFSGVLLKTLGSLTVIIDLIFIVYETINMSLLAVKNNMFNINSVLDYSKDKLANVFDAGIIILNVIGGIFDFIYKAIATTIIGISTIIIPIISSSIGGIADIIMGITTFVGKLGEVLGITVSEGDMLDNMFVWIGQQLSFVGNIGMWLGDVISFISDTFIALGIVAEPFILYTVDSFMWLYKYLSGWFSWLLNSVDDATGGIITGILNWFKYIYDSIFDIFNNSSEVRIQDFILNLGLVMIDFKWILIDLYNSLLKITGNGKFVIKGSSKYEKKQLKETMDKEFIKYSKNVKNKYRPKNKDGVNKDDKPNNKGGVADTQQNLLNTTKLPEMPKELNISDLDKLSNLDITKYKTNKDINDYINDILKYTYNKNNNDDVYDKSNINYDKNYNDFKPILNNIFNEMSEIKNTLSSINTVITKINNTITDGFENTINNFGVKINLLTQDIATNYSNNDRLLTNIDKTLTDINGKVIKVDNVKQPINIYIDKDLINNNCDNNDINNMLNIINKSN